MVGVDCFKNLTFYSLNILRSFSEKYKERYLKRYRDMLNMVPALRYLSIWHNDLMAFAKTFGPISDRAKPKPPSCESTHNSDYEHSVRMIGQLQI